MEDEDMVSRLSLMLLATTVVAAGLVGCGNGNSGGSGSGGPTAASAGAVGHAGAHLSGTPAVTIDETDNLTFKPNASTVSAGQVVHWMNTSSVAHNVTFDGQPSITSPTMSPRDTWDVIFTSPGTYQYHCTFHPGMTGTITVKP